WPWPSTRRSWPRSPRATPTPPPMPCAGTSCGPASGSAGCSTRRRPRKEWRKSLDGRTGPRNADSKSNRIGSDWIHLTRPGCEEKQVPRALLLTGDAAEELDTMYPYYRVQEGGWDVDVSSRTMRDVQLVIHEFDPNSDAYVEKNGRKLPVDVTWAEVDLERYDALIIPGGR